MTQEREKTEDRIKSVAINTDKLIVKLDTLTNRIDTARANENRELVEYYERQFAEASVEFLDGVESILDDWYVLKGETRPPARLEYITPETLDIIHNAVVSIVQGLPFEMPEPLEPSQEIDAAQGLNILKDGERQTAGSSREDRHRVDVTG
jgi:hypothetical protein